MVPIYFLRLVGMKTSLPMYLSAFRSSSASTHPASFAISSLYILYYRETPLSNIPSFSNCSAIRFIFFELLLVGMINNLRSINIKLEHQRFKLCALSNINTARALVLCSELSPEASAHGYSGIVLDLERSALGNSPFLLQ